MNHIKALKKISFTTLIFIIVALLFAGGGIVYAALHQPADANHAEVTYGGSTIVKAFDACKVVVNNSTVFPYNLHVPINNAYAWFRFRFSAGDMGNTSGYSATHGITLQDCPNTTQYDVCTNIPGSKTVPQDYTRDANGYCTYTPNTCTPPAVLYQGTCQVPTPNSPDFGCVRTGYYADGSTKIVVCKNENGSDCVFYSQHFPSTFCQ